jgi:hypothetical protein
MIRNVPESFNREDWPRLVAQAVNALARRPAGGAPASGSFEIDDNTGMFLLDDG